MKGIFHTGITVSNLDKSIPFYRDVLRLEIMTGPTEVFEGDELSRALGVGNARLRLVIFKVGEGSLELIEYLSPESQSKKPMPPNTLGAMHVAFRVDDVGKKVEELKGKGINFLSQVNVVGEGPLEGWKWIYFKDPDGITLELVEYHRPG